MSVAIQRGVITVALLLTAILCLFPPRYSAEAVEVSRVSLFENTGEHRIPLSWSGSGDQRKLERWNSVPARIDFTRLLTEIFCVASLTAVGVLWCRWAGPSSEHGKPDHQA